MRRNFVERIEEINDFDFDMWEEIGIKFGGYSSLIDYLIIGILKEIAGDNSKSDKILASELETDYKTIEIVKYMICNLPFIEYGTSPRACFATDKDKLNEFIDKCEKYYYVKWIKETE